VRRVRDLKDRRKVIVEADQGRLAELNRLFGSYQEAYDEFLSAYTDEQLATIADYLTRAAQHARQTIDMLHDKAATQADDGTEAR
jgi:Mg2+ and Co2+ transporter CorA